MTETELKKIISRGETLTVEFKSDREKLSDRALVEALAAMAERTGRGVDRIFEGVLRYGRVDECIREWLGQDVVRLAAGGKAYALTAMSLKKMGRDGSYISDLEEAEIRNRALDYLERFGTIRGE